MKKISIIITVLALVLGSCATNKGSAGGGTNVQDGGSTASPVTGASSGQIAVETKLTVLFVDGSLDEYTTSDYDSNFTNLLGQTRYSASGALLERVEFTYDQGNRLIEKTTLDTEDKVKTRIVYQYNDQGRLVRETIVNKSGKAVSAYEYGYDAKGNRISRVINSGSGVKLAETVYTYNNAGLAVSSETKDGSGRKVGSTESQYDARGNLVTQRVLNAAGALTTTINAVWQNGLEVKDEQLAADGKVQLRIANEYGAGGELLRKTVDNIQGESTQIINYEYTFKPDRR